MPVTPRSQRVKQKGDEKKKRNIHLEKSFESTNVQVRAWILINTPKSPKI